MLTIVAPILLGLFGYKYLPSYVSKKAENLATKEDIGKITKEVEEVKNLYRHHYDLSKAEKEFYNDMVKAIYKFVAEIKKYEFKHGKNSATKEVMAKNDDLRNKFFEFVDSANEILAKAFVFLKEENYIYLKNAIGTNTKSFADITKNLLHAMRKSLYPDTKLDVKKDTREFNYN